jgi:hypothetical protein
LPIDEIARNKFKFPKQVGHLIKRLLDGCLYIYGKIRAWLSDEVVLAVPFFFFQMALCSQSFNEDMSDRFREVPSVDELGGLC